MSIVPKETIQVIAQTIGITNLSSDAAHTLAPDVEYRIREVMQEAIKCMHHSRRTRLTVDDVDGALRLRNVEPIYGFGSGGPLRFKRALGHRDLFYIEDKVVDFKEVIEAPLPKAPLDVDILCHWLAIEGVQPAIPENAPVEVIKAPSDTKAHEQKDGPLVDIKLPVKHVLSRELQLYFEKIAELTVTKSNPALFKEALTSLASDSGLHPLVPYFTNFIAHEVSSGLNDHLRLFNLMHVVRSLLQNPHIYFAPYLHELIPSVVTCLVSKKLGNRFADNHWELRDFAANLVALICKRYGHVFNFLQTRITKTLLNALLNPKKALTQHYGAIQGLAGLGRNVVRLLILPNLEPYLRLLESELFVEKQKNEMKRLEAWRVYGALLHAAGKYVYDCLKIFPPSTSSLPSAFSRRNGKVITTNTHKRKRSDGMLDLGPVAKKQAVDGPVVHQPRPTPSMTTEPMGHTHPTESNPDPPSSSSGQFIGADESTSKDQKEGKAIRMKAILDQVWKDDLNSGRVLVSLLDQFGERILPFVPSHEMSMFL